MSVMSRNVIALAAIAFALSGEVQAQGVAPGGPIAGSTGIGSGLGNPGPGSTAPSWPNGTLQAPQPSIPSVTPGGGSSYSSTAPAGVAPSTSIYRQPSTAPTQRMPSTVPLSLATPDVARLNGCWRTDVFVYEQHTGITTWCFNDKGTGRVLYTRLDQSSFSCNAQARAMTGGRGVVLSSLAATCSDGSRLPLGDLDCRQNGEVAQCSGSIPERGPGETWSVGL
ncbi:MAG: hypothetical protein ACKOEC_12525 [Acidimicrobiia bacterium]